MSAVLTTPNRASNWYSLATQNAGNLDIFCNAAQQGRAETTLPIGQRFLLEVPQYGAVQCNVVDAGGGVRALSVDLPTNTVLWLPTDEGQIAFLVGTAQNPPNIIASRTSFAWIRSDLSVLPGVNAQGVASWTDQVNPSGNIWSQGTGAAQGLYTNPDAAVNNRPSVGFDGVQQWEESNASALAAAISGTDTPFCSYFILRPTVLGNAYFCAFESSSVAGARVMTFGITPGPVWSVGRVDNAVSGTSVSGGVPVANTTYLVRIYYTGTAVTLIANGVTAINAQALDTGDITMDRCCLGAHRQGGNAAGAFWNGKLMEAYWCSGGTPPAEEAQLITYFQSLYPGVS